jgi:hypothetical protein
MRMRRSWVARAAAFSGGLGLAFGLTAASAPAALDVYVGARNVVQNESLNTCNSKAQAALTSVLGRAAEYGDTGLWQGFGVTDASGSSFAAAVIHCYPLDQVHGYLVTFTCATQTPTSPHNADDICTKLAQEFGGQP